MTVTACREVDHGPAIWDAVVMTPVPIIAPRGSSGRRDAGRTQVTSPSHRLGALLNVLVGPSAARCRRVQRHAAAGSTDPAWHASRPGHPVFPTSPSIQNLSVANEIPGAKRRASDRRHRAMPSHTQPCQIRLTCT
jgi:hypothetical protein